MGDPVRDGRVLPITRWVARFIIPWLAAAFLVLYGVPDQTTEYFAWTIRPEMTPIVMGAGYGAGVYFFYRVVNVVVVLDPRWSAARILVQGQILGFTLVLLGVARVPANFDASNVLTWGVLGGMVLYLIAILVLYAGMETR